jgi:group I intron endonuclease
MCAIYKITNLINGKVYIGKTLQTAASKRWAQHKDLANRGSNHIIHRAIKKYGVTNFTFEVIFSCLVPAELPELEKHFIAEKDCCILDGPHKGYNMTRGGEGFTTETARKYAGWNNPNYVNPWSGEKGSKMASEQNHKRSLEGTNPWAGEKGSELSKKICRTQLAEGRHPFQGEQGAILARKNTKKQIENGTHMTQKSFTCPHCSKVGVGRNMFRWHFNHCRSKSADVPNI